MASGSQGGSSQASEGFHIPHSLSEISDIFHHRHHPARSVPHRSLAAPESHPVPTPGLDALSKYFISGALCATVTHGMTTPIDVVKTRIQVDPALRGSGMFTAARSIIASEGAGALLTGFGPTAVGYFVQGGAKFAGYEYFKSKLINATGSIETATQYRTGIYLGSAAIAEFIADIALCPLEATRIRLVSERGFASGLTTGFVRILREEGVFRGFYSGFIPILCKQIPFALGQFTVHEWMNEIILRNLSEDTKKNMTAVKHTGIELTSGVVAGIAAATLSQPADTLLSQINKGKGGEGGVVSRLWTLGKAAGFRGLFAGLGPRMVMTAFLVSGQFAIYADVKKAMGAPPSIEIHKVEGHLEK